jgi:hypothetical protein
MISAAAPVMASSASTHSMTSPAAGSRSRRPRPTRPRAPSCPTDLRMVMSLRSTGAVLTVRLRAQMINRILINLIVI